MDKGFIYLITNQINGKQYVGQTSTSIEIRMNKHFSNAKVNPNVTGIDGAIKKYGKDNFIYEILEECSLEELNEKEIFYIQKYNTFNEGYNLTYGGDGSAILSLDEQQLLTLYNNGETFEDIAKQFNCSGNTIKKRLVKYNIDTQRNMKLKNKNSSQCRQNLAKGIKEQPIIIIETGQKFKSIIECARYLLDEKISSAKSPETIAFGIRRVLNGKRQQYYGLHFKKL